jgi:DNA repair exonuclease SbcCD ATPase subunit
MAEAESIDDLKDRLKDKDKRIAELRDELDEERERCQRLRERINEVAETIDGWAEVFELERKDDNTFSLGGFWSRYNDLIDAHNELVRKWNRFVDSMSQRNVGRPLAASDAQCEQVLKLHKKGNSLRAIVDETGLGFQTVRTIVAKKSGTDRTSKQHRLKLDPSLMRIRRAGNAMPGQVNRLLKAQKLAREPKPPR